jgi:hypothetical protein
MNENKKWLELTCGAALIAACSGKLAVDDTHSGSNANGGGAGTGGPIHQPDVVVPDASAGGSVGLGGGYEPGTGGIRPYGGAGGSFGGVGGMTVLGTGAWPGCYTGSPPSYPGTGGIGTGGSRVGGVNPTCPVDGQGFAAVDLVDMCDYGIDGGNSNSGPYRCPATSAELLDGLDCSEVTTEYGGFTKTVGCGFETIELQSYLFRGAYDLEHEYAASYDLSTGKLVGLVIKEPNQFGPCMSYAYRAGSVPANCPSGVTYKCKTTLQDPAYQGCRAPDEPGCAQCCEHMTQGGAGTPVIPNSCMLWEPVDGSTSYQSGTGGDNICPCACNPCAQCKLEDERGLRLMIRHPECNCSLPPTGEPCATWCAQKPWSDALCPGIL